MRVFILLAVILAVLFSATPNFQTGMSYCGFWQYVFQSPESDAEIDSMAATNIEWISVCVWWFQETVTSTEIFPFEEDDEWGTPTDSSIAYLVQYAHARGISIMLKPMVDPMDGAWRADINPTSWNAWFDSYRSMIAHYAALAESLNIEQFSIGCEYLSSSAAHADQWLRVIDTVRALYSGPITYAANWWEEFEYINWFDSLDAIGIDAYFHVSDHGNPTVSEIIDGWAEHIEAMETYLDTMGLTGKPVIFTEIGCGSYTGATMTPWNWDYTGVTINQQEQADYYEALFQAVYPRPWIKGFFLWAWDNPSVSDYRWGGAEYAVGFTPNGKLAQEVLRNWYGIITNIDYRETTPRRFAISAFPNPFNSSCNIEIPNSEFPITNVEIFDLSGRCVWSSNVGVTHRGYPDRPGQTQGSAPTNGTIIWTPDKTISSGVYLIKVTAPDGQIASKKIIYLK